MTVSTSYMRFRSLQWSDEFDGKELDVSKWDVDNEWRKGVCRGDYVGEKSCNTNRTENLQLRDGCLAIIAAREREVRLHKQYTSAKIISKQSWTYGRFEIRAALPAGKMLRSALTMIPFRPEYWAIGGAIYVMTNGQTPALGVGVHFGDPPEFRPQGYEYQSHTRLQDFHTYAIEWTESAINWFFDDINHYSLSINGMLAPIYAKKGQPFDRPFKLEIHLGVGGYLFPGQHLYANDSEHWECPALLVDYVRVYKRVYDYQQPFPTAGAVSSYGICAAILGHNISAMDRHSNRSSYQYIPVTELIILLSLVVVLSGLILSVLICVCVKNRKDLQNHTSDQNCCNNNEPQFYSDLYAKGDDIYYQ
ncbi:unnamed protein product [Oppiella nova]|uniref:GH16 domain-containing protein n=1 Tax=Oppiella nova TaxID=334625 RepID=A0A7R9QHD7_9ACAR|nr:unnamed protein product [Oppiella nova]CAG2165978.1 unnamed protein product [Oppiella nova]